MVFNVLSIYLIRADHQMLQGWLQFVVLGPWIYAIGRTHCTEKQTNKVLVTKNLPLGITAIVYAW